MLQILVGSATFLGGLATIIAIHETLLLFMCVPLALSGAMTVAFTNTADAQDVTNTVFGLAKTLFIVMGGMTGMFAIFSGVDSAVEYAASAITCMSAMFAGLLLAMAPDHHFIDAALAEKYQRWGEAYTREKSVMMS